MTDKLKDVTGGYGIVYKKVMKLNDLSIEAKAIYSYLCTYAGNKTTAFPSVSLICHELGIGEKRFYKYKKELMEKNIITTKRVRKNNKFSKTVYTLNHGFLYGQIEHIQNDRIQIEHVQNNGIKNNNTNSNNSRIVDDDKKNFGNIIQLYQSEIQMNLNQTTIAKLQDDYEMYGYNLMEYAIRKSALKNAYSYGFVNYLLKEWRKYKLTDIEAVKQYEERRNKPDYYTENKNDNVERKIEDKLNSVGYDNLTKEEKEVINKMY